MSVLLELFYRGIAAQKREEEAQCMDALTALLVHAPLRPPLGRRGPVNGHDLVLGTFVDHGGYEKQPAWLRHYGIEIGSYLTDGTPVQLQLI
jgi:hypothetical protein